MGGTRNGATFFMWGFMNTVEVKMICNTVAKDLDAPSKTYFKGKTYPVSEKLRDEFLAIGVIEEEIKEDVFGKSPKGKKTKMISGDYENK